VSNGILTHARSHCDRCFDLQVEYVVIDVRPGRERQVMLCGGCALRWIMQQELAEI
jgi:hypothetical protein